MRRAHRGYYGRDVVGRPTTFEPRYRRAQPPSV